MIWKKAEYLYLKTNMFIFSTFFKISVIRLMHLIVSSFINVKLLVSV